MPSLRTVQDLVRALPQRGSHAAVLAVGDDGAVEALSYADLGEHALRLASGLIRRGVRPGDMVVLFGPNTPAWITVRLALAACGAVAVALDDLLTDAEIAVLVPDSGARLVFAASAHLPRLARLPDAATRTYYALDEGDSAATPWTRLLATDTDVLPTIEPDDACMLVFTSGTTGTPKSFLLSHANSLPTSTASRQKVSSAQPTARCCLCRCITSIR